MANIIDTVKKHYMVEVLVNKAYYARKKVEAEVNGRFEELYSKLWDYSYEVLKCNLGSTLKLLLNRLALNM